MTPTKINKLQRSHRVDGFDCGREALNRFLIRYAFQNQHAEASQNYVALSEDQVIGYYTLVVGEVAFESAHERLTKGLARHPVPIMLLARLAIESSWQGRGQGSGLLKDSMRRTMQAAEIAGIRAFAVHAKNDEAKSFYEHFGVTALPSDAYHLFRLVKDIRSG